MDAYPLDKEEKRRKIIIRLRKIEGQIKGLERMVENEESCRNILVQVGAVRSAITKVGAVMIEESAKSCLPQNDMESNQNIEELVAALLMLLK